MSTANESLRNELIAEAERVREDTEHSAKGHFEAARIWEKINKWLGVPATILAAAAGVSAITDNVLTSAGLALVVAILSGLMTFLRPSDCASRHLKAGNSYNAVRNDARIFANIRIRSSDSLHDLERELLELNARRNSLNADSPQIPRWAYIKGRTGIEAGEATYKVDPD